MSPISTSERRSPGYLAVLGLALVLVGCAGDGSRTLVSHVSQAPLFSPGLLHWVASSPQGLVVRVAAADEDVRWAGEAVAALENIAWMPFHDLTIDHGSRHDTVFHLALVVHAPSSLPADSACSGDMTPTAGHSDVVIALCHDGRAIATARATAAASLAPDSSAFQEAVRAAAMAAFPRRNRDEPDLEPVIFLPVV